MADGKRATKIPNQIFPDEELVLKKNHQELVITLGADAHDRSQIKTWLQTFRNGDLSHKDAPLTGRPPLTLGPHGISSKASFCQCPSTRAALPNERADDEGNSLERAESAKKRLGFALDIPETPQISSLPENRVQVAVFNMLPDQHNGFPTSIIQFCFLPF
jgi:hypothetical protein